MKRSTRRKPRFVIPTKFLLMGLTIILFALMLVSYLTNFNAGGVGNVVSYVFVPMQKGMTTVGNWISEKTTEYRELSDARAENELLKAQVNELTSELNSLKLEQYDVEDLRQLLSLDATYAEYNKIAANVIGQDAGNWFSSYVLDKGSKDGIEVGMNVITQSGLVGIIESVGTHYSTVKSIIDDTSQVSAMVLSTSDNCVVSGDLALMETGQVIKFSNLNDKDGMVSVGDQVVTSYISSDYVQGLLVGYISDININANNLTKSGTITPTVDFAHIKHVYVITDKKITYEEELGK